MRFAILMHASRGLAAASLLPLALILTPLVASAQPATDVKEGHAYVSAEATHQTLHDLGFRAFAPLDQPDEDYPTIMIDQRKTFQTLEGFGAAFTDASASVFAKLSPGAQEQFLKASFDPVAGNGYTLCRTSIHSCDYSDEMYTYDDVAGDTALAHFSIAHDEKYRIPFMKRATAATGGKLKLFASPWSPPAWMKTNGDMLHGGKLKPEYAATWANYFIKYLQAYRDAGLPMWGLTVQNEPMATQVWESCIFTAAEERDFVRDHLGPALEKNGFSDVKLMIWDHNRGIMGQRAAEIYEDPAAARYVWGTAFHWYVGDHYDNVAVVHEAYPDKPLLMTEGSVRGTWEGADHLATSILHDLNNGSVGWVAWNLLLDEEGGPRHAGGLEGPDMVNADLKTGELVFHPPYYVFGQFTRFIRPGAKRIACTSNSDDLLATAFANTDGKIAVVVLNTKDSDQMLQLWIAGKAIRYTLPEHGIITIVL